MRSYPYLEHIHTPADLKALRQEDLPELCAEIREFLIDHVSRTGGHLASNLGAVELTVGIHRIFSSPEDAVFFDVGHQSYVHKLLTGRKDRFEMLRAFGGLSGFQRPEESPYDPYISGHASNSVSSALGLARADRLLGRERSVVCVLGDGALTGGMLYEALNDAGQSGLPLVILFNDNEMSIDRNVGALAKRLRKIRLKPHYFKLKARTKALLRRFSFGEHLISAISAFKGRLRTAILKETLFELMGFRYLGPADGNDMETVLTLLSEAKNLRLPVVVHLKTVKGRGYLPSEQDPARFHGISAFDAVSGECAESGETFSGVFGRTMCDLAAQDEKLCAVTAAMTSGTGLSEFAGRFPARLFDVGIAEEHAVTLASGLATGGLKPVCAIYSTFLQRGFDQMIHDVAIRRLPVVLAVDRAGIAGQDGATHQGAFDVPYLRAIPGMKLLSPASFRELRTALRAALLCGGPAAVRYPRGGEHGYFGDTMDAAEALLHEGADGTIAVYGILTGEALRAARILEENGLFVDVVKLNCLTENAYPLLEASVRKTGRLLMLEDCAAGGCLGERLCEELLAKGIPAKVQLRNLGARFVPEGTVAELWHFCGLDGESVAEAMRFECGSEASHG